MYYMYRKTVTKIHGFIKIIDYEIVIKFFIFSISSKMKVGGGEVNDDTVVISILSIIENFIISQCN